MHESDNKFLAAAITAARLAGDFIQSKAQNKNALTIEQKSLNDFVSEVDRGAEKIIRSQLLDAFPSHSFLGEEYGFTNDEALVSTGSQGSAVEFPKPCFEWVVDPLDGTTNFLRGIPHYAVSIGLKIDDVLQLGVVYDPVKNELFTASKGKGAELNGQAIHCHVAASMQGALLSTGIPFSGKRLAELDYFSDAMVGLLQQQTSGIRRLGAAALDLAYVAAGRYDGFWEAGLQPWDIAAGALIAEEAGARVSDFSGESNYLDSGNIIAAAPAVFSKMQSIVENAYAN